MADLNYKPFYRRHLPHIHPTQAQYFVTFRLSNSLPKFVVEELQSEYQELLLNSKSISDQEKYEMYHSYFEKFDQLLDSSQHGALWLQSPEIALFVSDAMQFHDCTSYDLISYTIMPNHVHLLFDHSFEKSQQPIHTILQSIKKYSARRANKIMNRTGNSFWQSESYDHVVRNEQETEDVIRYILYNPVKAGLCKEWNEWEWTYIKEEYKKFFT